MGLGEQEGKSLPLQNACAVRLNENIVSDGADWSAVFCGGLSRPIAPIQSAAFDPVQFAGIKQSNIHPKLVAFAMLGQHPMGGCAALSAKVYFNGWGINI